MSPVSDSYGGIPGYVIFWVLFAVALVFFIQRVILLLRLLKLGRPENRIDHLAYRLVSMLAVAFTQSSNLKSFTLEDPAAIGHAMMFWGLLIFGVAYLIFIGLGAGFGLNTVLGGSAFETVFFSALDIVAVLVILSMVWVVIKRYLIVPERLKREQNTAEKITQHLLITGIFLLILLHFGIEGFRYAAFGIPDPGPPLGTLLAQTLVNTGVSQASLASVFKSLWWLNFILLLAALIYAPRSKHLHPLTSFANMVFRNLGSKGSLKPLDLQKPENVGANRIQDFSWKQLLDLYACTWCGRCHVVCPAQLSGKPLSPREMILGLKEHLLKVGPGLFQAKPVPSTVTLATVAETGKPNTNPTVEVEGRNKGLVGSVISEEAIWSCTTCRACQEVCPVNIEHIDKIIDLRRHLQMVAITEVGRDPLKNMRVRGHPWRGTMYARTDWAKDLNIKVVNEDSNIDILFWVGCTEALEDRCLKIAQATATLMQQAGVNFGILGEEEICCGDPARRLGAEHVFQMLAMNNIQLLQGYHIKKIVTACPHCFNTFKNEYPQLGGQFEVIHHTQLIAQLIQENKLKISTANKRRITYQDPCYIGRYNDIYQPPRQIISSIPGMTLIEMGSGKASGFCCGGGGGRMWLEEKTGQRINEMRLGQALDIKAQVVATACPFCLQMLEDAARDKEMVASLKIKDIAELVAESLEPSGEIVLRKTIGKVA